MGIYFDTILAQPWAIEPTAAFELYGKAVQVFENGITGEYEKPQVQSLAYFNPDGGGWVASDIAEPGAVAVIPVMGPMVHRAGMLAEMCGITSYQSIIRQTQAAEGDENVTAIVYLMDTPGGSVNGLEKAAGVIRGTSKPTYGFADGGMVASAGLYLWSAMDRGVMSDKSVVIGSCGTVVTHVNRERFYQMIGEEVTVLTNPESPKKVIAPDNTALTDEGRAEIEATLSQYYNLFRDAVIEGREGVDQGVLDGRMVMGEAAIEAGLADEISNFNQFLNTVMSETKSEATLKGRVLAALGMGEKQGEPEDKGPDLSEVMARLDQIEAQNSILAEENRELKEAAEKVTAENESLKAENLNLKGQGPAGDLEKDPNPAQLYQAKGKKAIHEHPFFAGIASEVVKKGGFE